MTSFCPAADSSAAAALRSPPAGTIFSTSSNSWFRNLPVVLLSPIASLAPARPLSVATGSTSDKGSGSSIVSLR